MNFAKKIKKKKCQIKVEFDQDDDGPDYEELKSNGFIKSRLHRALEKKNWVEAKEFLKEDYVCSMRIPKKLRGSITIDKLNSYHVKYGHRLVREIDFEDSMQRLPIHLAAQNGAPMKLIKAIFKRRPNCVSQKSKAIYQRTPLHMICKLDKTEDESVLYLAKKHPHALLQCEEGGGTPLHSILEHQPTTHVVEGMLELLKDRKKEVLNIKDKQGQLALHVAMDYEANESIVELLVRLHPQATKVAMNDEYLPLHFASRMGCSERSLKALLQHNPLAVESKHNLRDTPIHSLFDNFSDKWDTETGKSLAGKASFPHMFFTMLRWFFHASWQKNGPNGTKVALSNILLQFIGSENKTVMTLARESTTHHGITNFIQNIQNGDFSYFDKPSKDQNEVVGMFRDPHTTIRPRKDPNVCLKTSHSSISGRTSNLQHPRYNTNKMACNHKKEQKKRSLFIADLCHSGEVKNEKRDQIKKEEKGLDDSSNEKKFKYTSASSIQKHNYLGTIDI